MFKHSYSGIITKGLGMPACCGLITMQFSLFRCTIEVVIPPSAGGGGAIPVNIGRNTHAPHQVPHDTKDRIIKISLSMKGKTWQQTYYTSSDRADVVVKLMSIIKKSMTRIDTVVTNVSKRVRALVTKLGIS